MKDITRGLSVPASSRHTVLLLVRHALLANRRQEGSAGEEDAELGETGRTSIGGAVSIARRAEDSENGARSVRGLGGGGDSQRRRHGQEAISQRASAGREVRRASSDGSAA